MSISLAKFQLEAIAKLNEGMLSEKREIILKSCTGSGKTIILTHFMDSYSRSNEGIVFIWLTPGKGNLEIQSKLKMDRYIHSSSTKLLSDIMVSGFKEYDFCFINWEKLTKKGNSALKEGEHTNFLEHIRKAIDEELRFIIIVDESHQNDTIKSDDIIEYFKPDKIIRCSATPKNNRNVFKVEVSESDVISEGLIKRLLVINEDFPRLVNVSDKTSYLLDHALQKQRDLRLEFYNRGIDINPLIIVQLPNNSDFLLEDVESFFNLKGITYENSELAIWLANRKQNLEEIENLNAKPVAVIIKQAVATGWDCPRAYILVKLRDNMNEIFEIQTIGRIRRMPEVKHYGSDLLDCCYLYTFDDKFTAGVKQSLGKGALDALRIFLKPEHRNFSLISEQKTNVPISRDGTVVLKVVCEHYMKAYNLDNDVEKNRKKLEMRGYIFEEKVVEHTRSGLIRELISEEFRQLDGVLVVEPIGTCKHGRDYHNCVADIGMKIQLDYDRVNTVVRRLFCREVKCMDKILNLPTREHYAFVINNKHRMKDDFEVAISTTGNGPSNKNRVTEKPFSFPNQCFFTYDGNAKSQMGMTKNVYKGYLSSAEERSSPEKIFEKYCEVSPKVRWFYKNGDRGSEYFSIVFENNLGKQKSFYPDYIVGSVDGIYVIETKGGFTKTGESEDIDMYTGKKFEALRKYITKYPSIDECIIKGGIVRQDKQSQELCICMDEYSDDIMSTCWKLLKEVM